MRILIVTDAFPPTCGGSGWSTYELARGLRSRGHQITVVQPTPEGVPRPPVYDGFKVIGFPAAAPNVPFVRNYFRNERLYRRLAVLLRDLISREENELVHAQHMLNGPPAGGAPPRPRGPSHFSAGDPLAGGFLGGPTTRGRERGVS